MRRKLRRPYNDKDRIDLLERRIREAREQTATGPNERVMYSIDIRHPTLRAQIDVAIDEFVEGNPLGSIAVIFPNPKKETLQ